MRDFTVARAATRRIDFPLFGGGLDEHRTRTRAGGPQRFPERADRIRIAGCLNTECRIRVCLLVGWRVFERDQREIRIQFLGENHRDGGVHPLPHFHLRHDERGLAGLVDADERVRRKLPRCIIRRLIRFVDAICRQMEREQKAARDTALDEGAARGGGGRMMRGYIHTDGSDPAARLIAARMRT